MEVYSVVFLVDAYYIFLLVFEDICFLGLLGKHDSTIMQEETVLVAVAEFSTFHLFQDSTTDCDPFFAHSVDLYQNFVLSQSFLDNCKRQILSEICSLQPLSKIGNNIV